MKHGRFLSNTYDPRKPDARMYVTLSFHEYGDLDGGERAWRHHMEWINANEIGRPQATSKYTCEQLEEMGMVGLYELPAD